MAQASAPQKGTVADTKGFEPPKSNADWQVVTKDVQAIIDTRYLLQTDDGAYVYLQTKGYRLAPP